MLVVPDPMRSWNRVRRIARALQLGHAKPVLSSALDYRNRGSQMIHLAYVSTATRLMSTADLTELLVQSRSANAANAITGMLLYKDRSFLQVLEGEADIVSGVFTRIQEDPRHEKIVTLFEEPIERREFPDWLMGFVNLDDLDVDSIEGFSQFMENPLQARAFFENPTRARKLLMLFRAKS